MKKIKIIVVDDHPIFSKGLITQLEEFPFVEVIGSAKNGKEFLDKIESLTPDLVIIDIKMPEINGIEATRLAIEKQPTLKIIALSMFGDDQSVKKMLEAGAKGFLLKNIEKGDLENAITTVMSGEIYFSRELRSLLPSDFFNFSLN